MISLPDTIYSPQDLTSLILEIKEYAKWYAHETIKQRAGSKTLSAQPVLSSAATTLLHNAVSGNVNPLAQLDSLVHELERHKSNAPIITLTLAAPAPNPVKKTLTAWCRKELSPDILVSFEYNRTLLGGLVVRYGSRVYDWSLRRAILTTDTKFSEVVARV